MSAQLRPSFPRVAPTAPQRSAKIPLVPFLALTLLLPTIMVIGNCVLGGLTPITDGATDDMSMLDAVWRLVQGQYLGTDFHDPRGFGLFQVAGHAMASAWTALLRPVRVGRFISSFSLAIVFCGCVVATRQLRHALGGFPELWG